MNKVIENYTFDALAKTITFDDYLSTGIDIERVMLVTNATTGQIVFTFGDEDLMGTVTDNVLTLATSTSGMSDTDKLFIVYCDDGQAVNTRTLSRTTDGVLARREPALSKTLSADGVVSAVGAQLEAIIVISTSGGGVSLYDDPNDTSSGVNPLPSIILPLGVHDMHGQQYSDGIYCDITGTITAVFLYHTL